MIDCITKSNPKTILTVYNSYAHEYSHMRTYVPIIERMHSVALTGFLKCPHFRCANRLATKDAPRKSCPRDCISQAIQCVVTGIEIK